MSGGKLIGFNRLAIFFVLALFLSPSTARAANGRGGDLAASEESIRGADLLRTIQLLAAPEMEGRGAGTAGEARAADYIAGEFKKIGVKPAGDRRGYFQSFEIALGVRLGRDNRLTLKVGAQSVDFRADESFRPFGSSDEGKFAGEVVFAGYGVTAPELNYDDYAGIDVKDKFVLVMTHEPQEKNPDSPFRRPDAFRYTDFRYKVLNAREHGARAIIVVTDPNGHTGEREELFAIRGGSGASAGIIAVNALRSVAEQMLRPAGKELSELQKEIDAALAPRSFAISGVNVQISVNLVREKGRAKNVLGILPGKDPNLREQAIVIGAHYDHLGRGGEHSLAPDQFGAIHPGADDNASGVAGVIGLARAFARAGSGRTLVFAAFSGEEIGLLGSAHYVKNPPWPLEKTYAMINMDMIGRMLDDKIYVMGVDTAAEFRPLVAEAVAGSTLQPSYSGDGYGPSDQTSFYAASIPVLMFFTGPHEDYHRPSDTADKINAEGLEKVARLVFRTASRLDERPAPLTFVRTQAPSQAARASGGGYGAYFGSIPDFSESETPGVRLTGV
ncbi:MAG TPA: M20/M25/M40 family metallo-hydrolase, partial [Verrucomicrobiae bacterium]|nr:M20/M25/M40 family metallo-hydrolase [Verrucomicrobiae bacterium]